MTSPDEDSRQVWREAKRVLLAQCWLTVLAVAVLALLWGPSAGAWALVGGVVCIAPSAWFASRLTRAAARSPSSFAIWFFAGEMLKVLAMVLLLVAVFRVSGAQGGLALVAGFVAAMQGYFLALRRSGRADGANEGGTNEANKLTKQPKQPLQPKQP